MTSEIKPVVSKEATFDKLEIRVGRIVSVETAFNAVKPTYVLTADFGKYVVRASVGRFTQHAPDALLGNQILGVLNFGPREIGGVISEFLCLGVQYPKAARGEATIITPLVDAKAGGKLF